MDPAVFDRDLMTNALTVARRGLGQTAPNPSVGAIIASEATGEIIARGWTQPGGRPHAETEALALAGERARGATMYVTLEPCSHKGETGPCADAIIAAGLRRVVVAIEDPDDRVAGRGIATLRAAGIEVATGVLAEEARWVTLGHILRVTAQRPFVTLKMALNSSGHIARGSEGKPVWVTGEAARAHGHLLRAQADAVIAGSGTVRGDNPELTCRLPGLGRRSPTRIVVSRTLDVPIGAKLISTARDVPVWFMCANDADPARRAIFEAAGVQTVPVECDGDALQVPVMLAALAERGITRLLVEGGPSMWECFAVANQVDEVVLFMANASNGEGDGEIGRVRTALAAHLGKLPLVLSDRRRLGPDTVWRFRVESG